MTQWRVTIDRQHPEEKDWRDTPVANRPGKIERICTDVLVRVFGDTSPLGLYPRDPEQSAIDTVLAGRGLDVTMEPMGTSYICRAVKV